MATASSREWVARGVPSRWWRAAVLAVAGVLLWVAPGAATSTDEPHLASDPGAAGSAVWTRSSCVTGTCHGKWGDDAKIYHEPLRDGPCTDCHIPDDGYDPNLHDIFTFTFPDLRAQCLACHEAVAKTLAGTTQVHKPADVGVCERCHDPHGNREELFIIPATQGAEGRPGGYG